MGFSDSIFFRRDFLIATHHRKEDAIGPVFREKFEANIIVPENFNTDVFGTFSGEIERTGTPLETARRKSKAASEAFNANLVIASEGSFGPHPSLYFIPADDEILLLTDYENNLEIAVREVSTKTNFAGKEVKTRDELKSFCETSGFPDHKVILKTVDEGHSTIIKDIQSWDELQSTAEMLLAIYGKLLIETDMRAMNNPTRMSVIAQAAEKLANLMNSKCPRCKTPGFDVGKSEPGLPCSLCKLPTESTLKHVYICKKCGYHEDLYYPYKKTFEDPQYCQWCNP
ncbi:hypothetical protein CKK33_14815 [Mucilaginibacter sp. MD40]|uniref:DUF6671 family protein n=1 Tax=Mucilaginibacter sp. MD40 TaxID=2029590 RepID=UPI000BAC70A0|nr:DUF6671 family protein [Mucilaginibacter sp. MD40]PAW94697.1 hypothetical protein CKK33_14815 [Mucilaginibacter sp. MD40]